MPPIAADAALADAAIADRVRSARTGDGIPDQLDAEQRAGYRAVFAAIRAARWADAQLQLDAMKPGPLHAIARAELFTAKGSPKVELEPLLALLAEAPELPQAAQLARLPSRAARSSCRPCPTEQRLIWHDGAPTALRAARDQAAMSPPPISRSQMQPFIKDDAAPRRRRCSRATRGAADPRGADRVAARRRLDLLSSTATTPTRAALAALAQAGTGDWAAQADWVAGLAAWRRRIAPPPAQPSPASRARAARHRPARRRALLGIARRHGLRAPRPGPGAAAERRAVQRDLLRPARAPGAGHRGRRAAAGEKTTRRRLATTLAAPPQRPRRRRAGRDRRDRPRRRRHPPAGEDRRPAASMPRSTRLAGRLDLPATQLWLAHNCPQGAPPRARATRRRTGRPTAAGASTRRWSMPTRCRNCASAPTWSARPAPMA